MAADLSTFRTQFPEFASTLDGVINRTLEEALEIHSASARATLFLTAHLLVINADGTAPLDGGSGVITSETIGSLKKEYKTQAESERDVFYAQTSYGRRFLNLERRSARSAIGAIVVG